MRNKSAPPEQKEHGTAFSTHVRVSQRAATALLTAVASGRSLPDVLSSIIEEWSRLGE